MGKRKLKTTACILPVDEAFLQRMIYRAAVHGGMCADGESFEKMPDAIKAHFAVMRYHEVVRSLILHDKNRGYTIEKMARLYRLTFAQVRYIVENFAKD